jgi:hypothetical protein
MTTLNDRLIDQDQLSNLFFSEAFPDANSPAELYRQVYKYTDCGAYMCMTIEYLKITGTCFDDYHEQMVCKTINADDLHELGTWKAMDERGQLAVSFTVGSIVEGVDYGTDDIEVEAKQLDEEPSEFSKRFYAALKEVEEQAESIWQDTHGCETCARNFKIDLNEEHSPIWKMCPACQGNGTSI